MALLFAASQRVTTLAGLPISGGKARIYDINTTTYSDVFSDEAMATPLANPVVADANGWLPAIYAAESTYDIAHLTAGDVVLKSWTDWPTFQSGTASSIERTLSGARARIDGGDIGDGQIGVRYNAGSPDPDDVGGYARFGGWDGTQGDKAIIDFAIVDVLEPKSLKEAGKRITGVLLTEATTFTTAASVAINLSNTPAGTRAWKITFFDMLMSASAALDLLLAYDATPTYKTGASDYAWTLNALGTAPSAPASDDADAKLRIASATGALSTSNTFAIEMTVITPNSGTGNTLVFGRIIGLLNAAAAQQMTIFEGTGLGSYGRATYVKMTPASGTVTGKYKVEALRGFGE